MVGGGRAPRLDAVPRASRCPRPTLRSHPDPGGGPVRHRGRPRVRPTRSRVGRKRSRSRDRRSVRAWERLPRRRAPAVEDAGSPACRGRGTGGERKPLRRHRAAPGARARVPGGARVAGEEHHADRSHARVVLLPRGAADRCGARSRRARPGRSLWDVSGLHRRMPDRGAPRPTRRRSPGDGCAPVYFLPDH